MYKVPPKELIFLATGGHDETVFLATGAGDKNYIVGLLDKAGVKVSDERIRVLDWGCGCGRIARHWNDHPNVELFGCDVAEAPVQWCQKNLPFARFSFSRHDPPLPFPDGYFDAIYGISVCTHIAFNAQFRWMQELWRILKPTGVAVLTMHGATLFPKMLPAIAAGLDRTSVTLLDEELFFCLEAEVGSNSTGIIQSRAATERIFSPFDLVEYRPRFGLMGIQDSYVLRKKRADAVKLIDVLLDRPMSGDNFCARFDLHMGTAGSLSVLATVPELPHPAELQIAVGGQTSAPVSLPTMLRHTGLAAAFSSVRLDNISGSQFEVTVKSSRPLDGCTLRLTNCVIF